jgi:hypothetical protein
MNAIMDRFKEDALFVEVPEFQMLITVRNAQCKRKTVMDVQRLSISDPAKQICSTNGRSTASNSDKPLCLWNFFNIL